MLQEFTEKVALARRRMSAVRGPLQMRRGLLFTAVILNGCAVGPNFKTPSAPRETAYTEHQLPASTASAPGVGGAAQRFVVGENIPAQWWTLFRSPEIDGLVRDALANSPTLGAAQANLRQARETLIGNKGGLLLPSVTGQLQDTRQRESMSIPGVPQQAFQLNTLNATLDVSYNVDAFGSARRQIEGYKAQFDATRYQLEATYLTLTSNVVTTALREASYRAQLRATEDIARAQASELKLVSKQFAVGAVPTTTVLQQRTQLATTRASIPALEEQLAQTRIQLAVLLGKSPSTAKLPEINLDNLTLPTELPVSLPSSLVRQRPDIQASEAQLHQASAQVGVATAALFPQFSITGEYGDSGTKVADLLNPANAIWSLGAGLTQPIFKGGQLRAQRRAAIAAYDASWQQYRSTVLQGIQDVANSLVALDADAKAVAADAEADRLARRTLDLASMQYKLGAVSYLTLLDAQRQYYQAHITLTQAQANRFIDTATLFQALGGGWWNRSEPLADVPAPSVQPGRAELLDQ